MSKPAPILSILITAYNREDFIGEAIESVLESTFQDFEIIIVDDASTDGTADVVKEYMQRDNRIIFERNTLNLGQFGNRNKAAFLARSHYIKYLDSDDLLLPKTLEIFMNGMMENPSASIGVEFNNGSRIEEKKSFPFVLDPENTLKWHFEKGGLLFSPPSSAIYKLEDFNKVGGFSESAGINADVDLHLKLSSIRDTIVFRPGLVFWRRHAGQGAVYQEENEFLMMQERFNIHRNLLKSKMSPLTPGRTRKIIFSQKSLYMRRAVFNYLLKGKVVQFFSLLHRAGLSLLHLPMIFIPLRYIR